MLWSRAPSPPTAQAFPGALLSTSVSFVHTSAPQTQVAPAALRIVLAQTAKLASKHSGWYKSPIADYALTDVSQCGALV